MVSTTLLKAFILCAVLHVSVKLVLSYVCRPDAYEIIQCKNASETDCRGPNHRIGPGACGCCAVCYTILSVEGFPFSQLMQRFLFC